MKNKKLEKALLKKALGYDSTEVIEEYGEGEDGCIRLIKKKVTKKNIPPDLAAIKMVTDGDENIAYMTDEELIKEKNRLLKTIKGKEK